MKIDPLEDVLTGEWVVVDGRVVADEASRRISQLTHSYLVELGKDPSGWDVLYRDPVDGRLWELTYPQSHFHGGGPPQLRHLTSVEANQKYPGVV